MIYLIWQDKHSLYYPDTFIILPSVVIVVGKFCEDDYQYYLELLRTSRFDWRLERVSARSL